MSYYDAKARKAKQMLTKRGQIGQIARSVTTGGGPSDPSGGTVTTTRYPVRLVVFPIEIDRVDGTNIQSGDFRVICSTADVEIKLSDRIECSEGTLNIKDLGRFAPDGTIIFYDMVATG
ncbi:hypothetical protein [Tateyamaria sp.]|uniref:hypothetical protein n=1 Tax=Tateyamaria sp. TaxID=1929288 RepID=UPI003B20BCEF